MIGVCGVLLVIGCFLLMVFSKEYEGDIFARMGSLVYDSLQNQGVRFRGSGKVKKDLEGLYSVRADEEQCRDFYVAKLRLMIIIIQIDGLLSLLV